LTASPGLIEALEGALGRSVDSARAVAGGDINDAWAIELAGGSSAFVKTRAAASVGEYEGEASGLRWLGEGPVGVPEVLAVGDEPAFLALEWVEPGRLSVEGAERFGRGLAELHALGAPAFGWLPGGTERQLIGSLGLPAATEESWPRFYAEQRLRPLAEIAADRGALSANGVAAVEVVRERIVELAGSPEPPARLHGDLWAGNLHADPDGEGWLIDPSAHGGHREVDLAMLPLFGAPHLRRILAAYEDVAPLADGADERVRLWQLLPLLVHAALFGGHYGAAVERAARAYV
jgi:fructosamine-3-kinase